MGLENSVSKFSSWKTENTAILNNFELHLWNWRNRLYGLLFSYLTAIYLKTASLIEGFLRWVYVTLTLKSFSAVRVVLSYDLGTLCLLFLCYCRSCFGFSFCSGLLFSEFSGTFLFCLLGSLLFLLLMQKLELLDFFLFGLSLLLDIDWSLRFLSLIVCFLHLGLFCYIPRSLIILESLLAFNSLKIGSFCLYRSRWRRC